jgi:hypothetical protein
MILVAGGDSFIWGAELADQKRNYSLSTYPALLAKKHNMEYVCSAWSGNSNNAITRMTLSDCQKLKNQNIAVLITWTFVQRYEFRFNYDTHQATSPWYSINSWTIENDEKLIASYFTNPDRNILNSQLKNINTAKQTGVADFAKTFYMHVGYSEYYELYTSLKEIVFMQQYLKLNNIPYIFTSADFCFYNHVNYIRSKDQFLSDLYNQIDWDHWFFFPSGTEPHETVGPRGFYQWAVENKYKVGTTHPLEEAHAAASELLEEKFNELVIKNL